MAVSKNSTVVLVLAFSLFFAGCASNAPGKSTPNGKQKSREDGKANYPEAVMNALEVVKPLKVGTSVTSGDKTYIIASFGRQPTAGYKAKITDVQKNDKKITVKVALDTPRGDAAATVITYPYAVKEVKGRFEDVEFIQEGDYMPRILGLKEPLQKPEYTSENIMVFDYDPAVAKVTGIARMFEGTINYQLRSDKGTVLDKGSAMTAAGAPDWGYFTLKFNRLPENTSELVVYQASAKDGSMRDEIFLPVTSTDA